MEARVVNNEELTIEHQLEVAGQLTVKKANDLVIESNEGYDEAGKLLVQIKTQEKKIKEYWKAPKAAAKAAHATICDREKEMLAPLAEAEKAIKASIAKYQAAVEKARREAEEDARKIKEQETERLLNQAIEAEEAGDDQAAAIHAAMAEMVNDLPPATGIETPKSAGVGVRKVWKARVIANDLVPAYYNGIEIRKIDMSALNSLARMSKGMFKIPGVEFYEDQTVSVRT